MVNRTAAYNKSLFERDRADQYLNYNEINEYFGYLKQADEFFKRVFFDFPEQFSVFVKSQQFEQLRSYLKEELVIGGRYSKMVYKHKKEFIEKMKQYLTDLIGGPYKRKCIRIVGNSENWHEAFKLFLSVTHAQHLVKKQEFKSKLRELLHP